MKSITVNVSSKPFQSLFMLLGGLFLVFALYLSMNTKTTADHLYALYDIQLEQYQDLGIEPKKTVITNKTIREISNRFENNNLYAVIAMCISGIFFLMLAIFLYHFNVNVNNETKEDSC